MALEKQSHHENEIRLTLDGRNRVNLSKLLPNYEVSSFKAYVEDDKIILEAMAEMPAHELWLYKNPKHYQAVQQGLDQAEAGKVKKLKRDFQKFIDEEL